MTSLLADWIPVPGDATLAGRCTVLLYLGAALCCARCAQACRRADHRRSSHRWMSLAGLLTTLGIIKQFNLLTIVTTIGRSLMREYGVYAQREMLTISAIIVTILAFAVGLVIARRASAISPRGRRVLTNIALLVMFIIIRSISFHDVDALLSLRVAGARLNVIAEISLLLAVLIAMYMTTSPRGEPEITPVCGEMLDGRVQVR